MTYKRLRFVLSRDIQAGVGGRSKRSFFIEEAGVAGNARADFKLGELAVAV
jgi:hypothetical protein